MLKPSSGFFSAFCNRWALGLTASPFNGLAVLAWLSVAELRPESGAKK